jgi:hypothetical protein
MPVHTLSFYDLSPFANGFSFASPGTTFTYTGPATADGTLVVTDNGAGLEGEDLTRDETATADATINGNTSTGSNIDATAGFLIRDTVTGESFAVIRLVVEDGPALGQYTLSEQPLVSGRTYELQGWATNPSAGSPGAFTYADYVCFASGTLIETTDGPQPIENLRTGSRVITLDHGPQTIIWAGSRRLTFDTTDENQKPILLKQDALGPGCPQRDLVVSPQHRIFIRARTSETLAKDDGFLAPAKFFKENSKIRVMHGKRSVTYHTLMTTHHEIIFANGLGVETFYPGPYGLSLLSPKERLEIQLALFERNKFGILNYGRHARPVLNRHALKKLKRVNGRSLRSLQFA